jgi:hypothetical protein
MHQRGPAKPRPGTAACRRFLLTVVLATWLAAPAAAAPANATAVGTDGTFSGFTVGAAVVAVLAGGAYRYYRR